jgi:hypothetical protein
MPSRAPPPSPRVSSTVRARIERGGERLWRLEDFSDLPFAAVAQALSRLARAGQVQRLSKGTYYRCRQTAFGPSRPNPTAIQRLAGRRTPVFPSGISAARLLGFTTQTPAREQLATSASSLPRKLIGPDTLVHSRRPAAWADLSITDAALLDFLRGAGRTSELPPEATVRRAIELLREGGRFNRLARIAGTEPPRVRAMLGALGERIGAGRGALDGLRRSLNPLSRFDFGVFGRLPEARAWQAKGRRL